MRFLVFMGGLLAIAACSTTSNLVSCDNADKVRAAATLAIQAVDRACPITSPQ